MMMLVLLLCKNELHHDARLIISHLKVLYSTKAGFSGGYLSIHLELSLWPLDCPD